MNKDTRNLGNKKRQELDTCECTDRHCSHCNGECTDRAVVTMYDTTKPEEQQTGRRMCNSCAFDLFESSGGQWQSDLGRNPDEYDAIFGE